jgi:hypothetical protein
MVCAAEFALHFLFVLLRCVFLGIILLGSTHICSARYNKASRRSEDTSWCLDEIAQLHLFSVEIFGH